MNAPETNAAAIERLQTLEPGTDRHQTLSFALDFRRSWLGLGRQLALVKGEQLFKEWGYRTIRAYALHELQLREAEMKKLLRGYEFMNTHEPRRLAESEEPGAAPLPRYDALDVLASARENPYLSETDFAAVRDEVFSTPHITPDRVRKAVKERAPVADQAPDASARLRKALALAERLYGLLIEEEDIPVPVTDGLEKVIGRVRRMLEE